MQASLVVLVGGTMIIVGSVREAVVDVQGDMKALVEGVGGVSVTILRW